MKIGMKGSKWWNKKARKKVERLVSCGKITEEVNSKEARNNWLLKFLFNKQILQIMTGKRAKVIKAMKKQSRKKKVLKI